VHAAAMKMETDEIGHREAAASANAPLLSARELTQSLQDGASAITVLDGVNLTVDAGEMIAIVGRREREKALCCTCWPRWTRQRAVQYTFNRKHWKRIATKPLQIIGNKQVGFVWQRHHLLADFTAAENVAMPVADARGDHGDALETRRAVARRSGAGVKGAASSRGVIRGGATARGDCASVGQRSRQCCWRMSPPGTWTNRAPR
jgi:lipoprotein-releasing system ATP-binding protein